MGSVHGGLLGPHRCRMDVGERRTFRGDRISLRQMDAHSTRLVLGPRFALGACMGLVAHKPRLHRLGAPAAGSALERIPRHRFLGRCAGRHRAPVLPVLFRAQFRCQPSPNRCTAGLPQRLNFNHHRKRYLHPAPRPLGALWRTGLPLGQPAVRAAGGFSAAGVATLSAGLFQPWFFFEKNECDHRGGSFSSGPIAHSTASR